METVLVMQPWNFLTQFAEVNLFRRNETVFRWPIILNMNIAFGQTECQFHFWEI